MRRSAASAGSARQALGQYLPPLRDRRFWITQGLILAVFVVHGVLRLEIAGYPSVFVVIAYTFPVLYAALEFGFRGSIATTGLVVVLSLPYVISDALAGSTTDLVGQVLDLAVLIVVAPVVGSVVESERIARRAHERAEQRYRALFETSAVPAIVVDGVGAIQEANPSAAHLLRGPLLQRTLADVLGTDTATALLGDAPPDRLQVTPQMEIRPAVSHHESDAGEPFTQIIFQDVTEEASGQRRARAWGLAVLVAQEEERRRIAQDLHDQALQLVVELRRHVDRVVRSAPKAGRDLLAARDLADQTLDELRTVTVRLRPPDLDDLGLVASLERLAADAERRGLPASLDVEGTPAPIPPDLALAFYRVGQEALTNAEQHAHASRVTLRVTFAPGQLRLEVADDGLGFDVAHVEEVVGDVHLGLVGMRERMQLVGGQLELRSEPGRGTTVVASAAR